MKKINSAQQGSGLILDRRELMAGAAALGLSFGALGGPAFAAETPKKGGTLRLGMEGGSASDSLDPRTFADSIPISYGLMLYNALVEIDENGKATGDLLESWEPKPGAVEWVLNVRKGIKFTSGKTLDADDIIYSINMHRGKTISGAKDLLSGIKELKKLDTYQVLAVLESGDYEFPYNLTHFSMLVVADGATDFSKPNGTGAFTLESFQPGVRILAKNKGDYWREGRGHFDSIDLRYIQDATARTQALLSGQIDAANRIPPKTAAFVAKSPKTYIVQTKGTGDRFCFAARANAAPYDNADTRLALKYGIDRQKIVDIIYKGYASLGNDTLVVPSQPFFAHDIPQRAYDPDKALFHYKKAGNPTLELQVSEGAFNGATDAGVLYQEAMKKAGIPLSIKRVSGDGYWSNVWLKEPFSAVYWAQRPTVNIQLAQTFLSTANWNDTAWKRPEFDKLILAARAEGDEGKRQEMLSEAQRMVVDDGGMICYAVGDYLDGYSKKVKGTAPHPRFNLCDDRIAEKGWFG